MKELANHDVICEMDHLVSAGPALIPGPGSGGDGVLGPLSGCVNFAFLGLERNRFAVGKYELLPKPASALLRPCFASPVACLYRPSYQRDQSTY